MHDGRRAQLTAMLEVLACAEAVPGKKNQWRNTQAGNTASSAKPPHFKREKVLEALESLKQRVQEMNADPKSPFRADQLITFGDFLNDQPKVQAADVGIKGSE